MNILYISVLDGGEWNGPTYSIPKQISYQSEIDNVFWYNLVDAGEKWRDYQFFHDITEYPSKRISDLPKPFDSPDLIVFEQFYCYNLLYDHLCHCIYY